MSAVNIVPVINSLFWNIFLCWFFEFNYLFLFFSWTDVDYCSKGHFCHENASCLNLNTKSICICNTGFTGDGFYCEGTSNASMPVKPASLRHAIGMSKGIVLSDMACLGHTLRDTGFKGPQQNNPDATILSPQI